MEKVTLKSVYAAPEVVPIEMEMEECIAQSNTLQDMGIVIIIDDDFDE